MTEASPTPLASVVIPTYNRKEILEQSIRSALSQTVPVEVVVVDDGSSDGTGEMVRSKFPQVRYHDFAPGNGPSILRNRGIAAARCDICFPIDDDAVFVSQRTVEQTLAEFNDDPRIAAVAIPYINVRKDPSHHVWQRSPGPGVHVCQTFVGCAHALRRDVFLGVGGYREHFYYMGEEPDVCLRMLAAGYVTRLGTADPMHHFESPSRSTPRADFYGRRNDILYAWHNVPTRALIPHLVVTTFNGARYGFMCGRPWTMIKGLAAGYASMIRHRYDRETVPADVYRLSRELKRRGAVALEELTRRLPPRQTLPSPPRVEPAQAR
jgi:glycosyltransferase involved in cell wall biosynthesis